MHYALQIYILFFIIYRYVVKSTMELPCFIWLSLHIISLLFTVGYYHKIKRDQTYLGLHYEQFAIRTMDDFQFCQLRKKKDQKSITVVILFWNIVFHYRKLLIKKHVLFFFLYVHKHIWDLMCYTFLFLFSFFY